MSSKLKQVSTTIFTVEELSFLIDFLNIPDLILKLSYKKKEELFSFSTGKMVPVLARANIKCKINEYNSLMQFVN
jgi:hypothetical protein